MIRLESEALIGLEVDGNYGFDSRYCESVFVTGLGIRRTQSLEVDMLREQRTRQVQPSCRLHFIDSSSGKSLNLKFTYWRRSEVALKLLSQSSRPGLVGMRASRTPRRPRLPVERPHNINPA